MNFNGKFWHKPGHLGMTTDEVKKALKALPTPEAGDAGKAVLVNADADGYELGAAGGGGGAVFVELTKEESDVPGEYVYVALKDDVAAAIAAGASMVKVTDDSGYTQFLPIVRYNSTNLWVYGIKFAGTIGSSTTLLKALSQGTAFIFA